MVRKADTRIVWVSFLQARQARSQRECQDAQSCRGGDPPHFASPSLRETAHSKAIVVAWGALVQTSRRASRWSCRIDTFPGTERSRGFEISRTHTVEKRRLVGGRRVNQGRQVIMPSGASCTDCFPWSFYTPRSTALYGDHLS